MTTPNSPSALRAKIAAAKQQPPRTSPALMKALDILKEGAERETGIADLDAQVDPTPAPAPMAVAKPPRAKKPPGPTLTHRCGHQKPIFEYTNIDCPSCRDANRKNKAIAKREKQAATGPKVKQRAEKDGRLPNCSLFQVQFDAAEVMWHGTLQVADHVWNGSASGVERLLRDLAGLYRATVAGGEKVVDAPTATA